MVCKAFHGHGTLSLYFVRQQFGLYAGQEKNTNRKHVKRVACICENIYRILVTFISYPLEDQQVRNNTILSMSPNKAETRDIRSYVSQCCGFASSKPLTTEAKVY